MTLTPLLLFPAALVGYALAVSRRGLSMLPPERSSPLLGVPALSWSRFVTIMAVSPKNRVSPRGRMGLFGMDGRRLADVGFMRSPRKVTIGAETGVWSGEWVAPLTEKKFLESPGAQYEALSRSVRKMAPKVAKHVGANVDGKKVSLSGLLAVGHLAGEAGVASWVADPAVRQKFGQTTRNFERANGLF